MTHLSKPIICILVAGFALALLAAPALAQSTGPTMPRPRFADSPPVLMNMILAFLLFFVVAAPNFIPSKRGHQD